MAAVTGLVPKIYRIKFSYFYCGQILSPMRQKYLHLLPVTPHKHLKPVSESEMAVGSKRTAPVSLALIVASDR